MKLFPASVEIHLPIRLVSCNFAKLTSSVFCYISLDFLHNVNLKSFYYYYYYL